MKNIKCLIFMICFDHPSIVELYILDIGVEASFRQSMDIVLWGRRGAGSYIAY